MSSDIFLMFYIGRGNGSGRRRWSVLDPKLVGERGGEEKGRGSEDEGRGVFPDVCMEIER